MMQVTAAVKSTQYKGILIELDDKIVDDFESELAKV